MAFSRMVTLAGDLAEALGVLVILAGALAAVAIVVQDARDHGWAGAYARYRHLLGRAILLGLEFLVAADIIRTVTSTPTLQSVIVLGLVVLIRTFLSFTLELETEGRWPWQRPTARPPDRE
jgi:uncharacterized membrane protein